VTAALPPEAQGKPIEVWFQDEARVGQQGTLTYVWAERGTRPAVPRDNRHHSVWLFGAVCPARGAAAGLALPHVSAEAMSLHLAEVSTQIAPGAHAVVVLDGAGWHQQGGRLKVPNNLTLLPLCLVAEHCWDPVGLAIVEYAHRFERLSAVAPRRG
jgi:hypothetical protein